MRKIISLLFVSTSLFFSQSVLAEVGPVVGAGAIQCGKFLDDLERFGRDSEVLNKSWMQGYLTAKNIGYAAGGYPFIDLSEHEGHFRYVKNYCAENPLKEVAFGVEFLWQELVKMQNN